MAAAQFSDDAYNKRLTGAGVGTLVGNWCEERVLREATGEGRTTAQRHIPRSGLLQDFTKVPPVARKGDNTFERVYGPKVLHPHKPASMTIGDFSEAVVTKVGPREVQRQEERERLVAEAIERDEEALEAMNAQRFFDTEMGASFQKPDETQVERAMHLKNGCRGTLWRGPVPDSTLALGNEGLEVPTHAHYSNMEQVTHARMCLGDPKLRSDVRVSAISGVTSFGRNAEFSKPVLEFTRGLVKDDELDAMYTGLKATQPLRQLSGTAPCAAHFDAVPSLPALKTAIHNRIREVWGAPGYMSFRQRLFDISDPECFVLKTDVADIIRNELGVTVEMVSEKALDVYLQQLVTMKRTSFRVGALLTSLRPAPGQKEKRRMVELFRSLGPVDGTVRLGAWLARVPDAALRATVVGAFGAPDEASAADTPLSESVFLELLSDLAPFMDVNALLA